MSKLKSDQKGFSAVEVILVLVILALVGAVGVLVAKNHNKTTTASTTTASTTKATTPTTAKTTTPDPYAGWQTYTATLEPVSFKYPKDWTVATGNDAPINQADNQFIRLNAPQRSINGVNYQYSLTFQIHNPTPQSQSVLPVYSSTKLTDVNFPKTLYSLVLLDNAPAGEANAGQAGFVEVSATNYTPGSNTDGKDTIPTTTAGRTIDMGGTYVQVNNNTLAYFAPSQFGSLQEIQQSNQIFSSLTQK